VKKVYIIMLAISAFIVFYAMVGYPLFLKLLGKIKKPKPNQIRTDYEPTVSYMIVAHNEETVIRDKLENAIGLDYPKEKLQILVASDNSTDSTNSIVNTFIEEHKQFHIKLYCSKEHKGKTNAQNEAQKLVQSEILVMTDANTLLEKDAIRQLVSYFTSDDIVYVCGKLEYSNSGDNCTSNSESTYWNLDLYMRDIESRIKSITAGNGALYAIRNKEYIDFDPIYCHDSIMPFTYGKMGKRALFNPKATAYEKAGENNGEEYKRKVRMNRDLLDMLSWGFSVSNPFRYGWFSIFYFGHRTCRYLIWLAHIVMIIATIGLTAMGSKIGALLTIAQIIFFAISWMSIHHKIQFRSSLLRFCFYYGMTVLAQIHGVINIITGKAKPVWEKAESTR